MPIIGPVRLLKRNRVGMLYNISAKQGKLVFEANNPLYSLIFYNNMVKKTSGGNVNVVDNEEREVDNTLKTQ